MTTDSCFVGWRRRRPANQSHGKGAFMGYPSQYALPRGRLSRSCSRRLLGQYQNQPPESEAAVTQVDLYSTYASRFSAAAINGRDDNDERLLTAQELIHLTRLTFPNCTPEVDNTGRFVIRGIERRDNEPSQSNTYPFEVDDPADAFKGMLKRKLAGWTPEPKKAKTVEFTKEDQELLNGLRRFKGSPLGKEVRDVCISQ